MLFALLASAITQVTWGIALALLTAVLAFTPWKRLFRRGKPTLASIPPATEEVENKIVEKESEPELHTQAVAAEIETSDSDIIRIDISEPRPDNAFDSHHHH